MYHELICTDCAVYISNDELPSDSTPYRDWVIKDGAEKVRQQLKHPSVGDEYGFSTQPCWACGSALHGNRHYLNYIDSIEST